MVKPITAANPQDETTNIKMRFFTLDNVYWLSQIGVVLFGVVALLSGKSVNNRQAAQLLTLQTELATAQGKQADAEKSLIELKARLAYRSIAPEIRAQMSNALRQFSPQAFEITTYPDDQECMSFAQDLAAVLIDAGWVLKPSDGWLAFSLITSITVEFGEARKADFGAAAERLATELTKAGFPAKTESRGIDDKDAAERIRIRLGKKP